MKHILAMGSAFFLIGIGISTALSAETGPSTPFNSSSPFPAPIPNPLPATPPTAQAKKTPPPNLLKISFLQGNKKTELPIPMAIGVKEAAKPGQIAERWTLTPGLVLKSERAPPDRVVELYQGKGAQRSLLMLVNVKFFRNRDGYWQPHFQPNETPLVAPDGNGGWRPIPQAQGRSGLLVLHGVSLPNAEGYYPTLEFGLTIGRASIDSWVVN